MLTSTSHRLGTLEHHRPALLRYARLQLRNESWAEDAVSETLLAALEKPQSFEGRAQLSTWLIGILKHKIIDHLRRHARECPLTQPDEAGEALEDMLFADDGHFRQAPARWIDPEQALGERQFFAVLEACVDDMPANQGRIFLMREWLEFDTPEICETLAVTPANVWVLLHRARMRLRECLDLRWFQKKLA